MTFQVLKLVIGLGLLSVGADIFVRGATNMASRYGVSPLIIGLTVVAFGTSAPELFVSLFAAWQGNADIAVGNVLGSNIFNILVIVGFAGILCPISISEGILRREMPIMIFVMGLFLLFGSNGLISRLEGILLSIGIFGYVYYNYRAAKSGAGALLAEEMLSEVENEQTQGGAGLLLDWVYLVLGLTGLVFGSEWIVASATVLAKEFGVSDLVIGVTIIAAGTSLPELATTIAAAYRGQPELAIGNAIGSNVFNVLCVLGFSSSIVPLSVTREIMEFDIWFMTGSCIFALVLMSTRARVSRAEGGLLLLAYVGYILAVVQKMGHV